MDRLTLICLVLAYSLSCMFALPLPYNQYAYMKARNNLTFRANSLNEKEKLVNLFMQKQKSDEFGQTVKYFYPSRPIETELENITSRPIYGLLKQLPKGGNLHIHEFQMLERRKLLDIVFKSPEYDWLYICDKSNDPVCATKECNCLNYSLRYYTKNVPNGWIKVKGSNWTIDTIVSKTTLTGILNNLEEKIYQTDTGGRWGVANKYGVFAFYSDLVRYNKTRFDYMKACLDSSLDENVQIIEFRRSNFGGLFSYDKDGNEITISPNEELDMLIRFKNEYMIQNPKLIDFIFLIYGSRGQSKSSIKSNLDTALSLQAKYPNMIRGYDLVGEEDQGHTLLFHSDTLSVGFNYSQNSNGTFNLVFHTAETNWPQDLEPAKYGDSVSTLDNVFDSILLKTSRVGHGLGFFKHPELNKYLKDREIAIEVCPASNQILGYVSDLRNHPAINYYRSGIPIVIAGDDPGSFGYNDLTVDYYLIYMAWGLDLSDLKTIANNSVKYSSIPNEVKAQGYLKFNKLWNEFIDQTYDNLCYRKNIDNFRNVNANFNVSDLLPSYGPNNVSTEVSVYGYGFEIGLCQKVYCLFGETKTAAEMVKLNEIRCKTPFRQSQNLTEKLQIQIGEKTFSTNFNFTFLPANLVSIFDDQPTNSSGIARSSFYDWITLIILNFCLVFIKK